MSFIRSFILHICFVVCAAYDYVYTSEVAKKKCSVNQY